ncbi:MAG: HEAT repeat domain-containing protein [Planctomycetes bacterium]|nr:HEAT repeat domain-containing protein [Planctomycetota bacterium]
MAMGFGMMEMLMLLLSGGGWGNDLLDYLPTSAYWRAKGVEVSVERMTAELAVAEPADLAQLIRDLGADRHATREAASAKLRALGPVAIPALKKAAESDDPEVRTRAKELLEGLSGGAQANAIRRLMAIRTLGELKKPEALAALRPLLEAKEPFVADYAARAIATIEGRAHERAAASREMLWRDLCLLPANCGIVAQLRMPGGQTTPFEEALKAIVPVLPGDQDLGKAVGELTKGISAVAERVGNLRFEGITLGVADNVGNNAGFIVAVARGRYDAAAVKAAFTQLKLNATRVEGMDAFSPERDVRFIPCSDDRFIFAAGPSHEHVPLKELAAALQANGDKPALPAKMLDLIKGIEPDAPVWAAAVMSDAYRQASFLAPYDTITAVGKNAEGGVMALTVVAAGKDPEAVKASVAEVQKGVKQGLDQIQQHAAGPEMAFTKPIIELMQSIRVQAEGAKATLTAKLKGQGAAFLMPMMMLWGVRSGAHRVPPPQIEPMPAVPEPQ